MTIPIERTMAVLAAERLLVELAGGQIKRVPPTLRARARSVLRHFPSRFDLYEMAYTLPDRWAKPE